MPPVSAASCARRSRTTSAFAVAELVAEEGVGSAAAAASAPSAFFLRCAVKRRSPQQQAAPGSLISPRVRDTVKISGRLACGHCLCGDLGAELAKLGLDLGRDRRELLGTRAQLVHELSVELGVLGEQLAR